MNQKFVETDTLPQDAHAARQAWMKILATSTSQQVETVWGNATALNEIPCEIIRKPERGLVMVRGRAGSAGGQFNLGEMTITRCAVRLAEGQTGVSYISGRNLEHALIAAKADALLQSDTHHAAAYDSLIAPLKRDNEANESERAAKVAATRVNFFTMVRTREDKK
ncbi:MAG: phosphonate C-P lyase system protein PhnG [Pseudomonadota bacterium]